jgi:hypothetical protein
MPKSMRNLLKYADNETYVMPENAHMESWWNRNGIIMGLERKPKFSYLMK